MVCVIKSEYQISYDKTLLNDFHFKNLRIIFRCLLCGPPKSKGEGLFYRIIDGDKGTCIQCLFFYKTQWIPYHPHDYHPFYIYLNKENNVRFLIIDDGHHFSSLIPIHEGNDENIINITVLLPDHGLTNQIKRIGKLFRPKLNPLSPAQIEKWWLINNMAQLKLRTKLIDPWASGLIPDTPPKKETLLYRINHLLPFKIFSSAKARFIYTFRDETVCPICHGVTTLDFMPLIHDNVTGNYFLRKKLTCQNNHSYVIKYDFEQGKIVYE